MPEENSIYKFRWQIALILAGITLAGLGFVLSNISPFSSTQIEIIEENSQSNDLVIEIAGAVVNPGVFTLPINSRAEDAINTAGGLSMEADMSIIQKSINRAAVLVDGQKLYIPKIGEEVNTQNISGKVNINTATASELESLWGVGPATSSLIIDNRPYSSIEDLLNKNILKSNVYERNKDIFSTF